MPATTAPKLCRLCREDVSKAKRIKDTQGNYYCARCYQDSPKQSIGDTEYQTLPTPKKLLEDFLDPDAPMIDLSEFDAPPPAPSRPIAKTPPAPAAPARSALTRSTAPSNSSDALPPFCPNCDAPVIGNRKLCVKCHKDVTQMGAIIARKAAAGKIDSVELTGIWIGRAIKGFLILAVVGIAVFLGVGAWTMFHPGAAFDEYPTTREAAVRAWLADIADGSDKGLENAFTLVSYRERQTNNPREDDMYKMVYHKIHDDFASKYGPDWLSKVKVANAEPGATDEIIPFKITLNDDDYYLSTQVQLSVEQAVANLTIRRDRPSYPEDGKRHFGVLELDNYIVHPRSTMLERVGPGKPFLKPN